MLGVIYDSYEEKLYTAINGQNSLISVHPLIALSFTSPFFKGGLRGFKLLIFNPLSPPSKEGGG